MKLLFSYFSVQSKLQELHGHKVIPIIVNKFDLLLLANLQCVFFSLYLIELQGAAEGILGVHSMNRYKIYINRELQGFWGSTLCTGTRFTNTGTDLMNLTYVAELHTSGSNLESPTQSLRFMWICNSGFELARW